MNNLKNNIWGIILIVLGIVIAINSLGIAQINPFFDGWWTLFIIVPSLTGLSNEKDKTGNIIFLIIGISLLLACQGLIDFSIIWDLAIPIVLIGFGLSLIFKNQVKGKIKIKNTDKNNYCSTFSEQNIVFDDDIFGGATTNSIFGKLVLDLKNAKIEEDVVINATSIFGQTIIIIPNDVNIKIVSICIFGNTAGNERKSNENKNTIYINTNCLFGGVTIR